jgi:hypothetical protein
MNMVSVQKKIDEFWRPIIHRHRGHCLTFDQIMKPIPAIQRGVNAHLSLVLNMSVLNFHMPKVVFSRRSTTVPMHFF